MRKFTQVFRFCLVGIAFLVFSCDNDPGEMPRGEFEGGILILNEGAFGANDGEVFHFDPMLDAMNSDVFEGKNGRPFAGLLQDMVEADGRIYLVANTGKVEVVDARDFSSIGAVSTGLDISRSLAVANQNLYISDWGPYDENFNSPDSYIAVVNDPNGGNISRKIPVSSRPEGLYVQNGNLLVACAAAGKLEVISLNDQTVGSSVEVDGTPARFFEDGGRLFLFARGSDQVYFHEINRGSLGIQQTIAVALEQPTGIFSHDGQGNVWVVTSSGWPDYEDAIAKITLNSAQVEQEALYTGSGFYGLGIHPGNGQIYVGDNNGFQGNGIVIVLQPDGQLVRTLAAGRGPSGFRFR
ncbi:YncE family protein [Pararhodonellum marinum]|uniref:YncE family protein n=1 Tax=Pararhodonellum marinum TaxID=2755358 RepID=UPI00188E231B|nr:DUF5074 domain-containing protein [Pararhodonellum marinum]